MLRSLAFGKLATAAFLVAVPLATTGCQTGGMKGWGWSPPSMSSLNPWRSSTDSQLANNSKPSSVPTPPPQMLSGQGLARGGSQANGHGSQPGNYSSRTNDPYASRGGANNNGTPGGYNASDYATRQASATQGEGYDTGRYATGGGYGQAQTGPYSSGGAAGYGGAAASTADRRSDSAYGAGAGGNTGWQNYNNQSQPQNNRGTYEGYNSGAANSYQGAAGGQSSSPSSSPYSGTTGVSGGARSSSTPAANYGADAYRPGSTARAPEIQPASFEKSSGNGEGNFPTTDAGDESGYQ